MNEYHKTWKIIDQILWEDWDPIGINDVAPRDEYQSYVHVIQNMVNENRTEEEIAEKLNQIASVTIGVGENLEHCRKVAAKILAGVENAT